MSSSNDTENLLQVWDKLSKFLIPRSFLRKTLGIRTGKRMLGYIALVLFQSDLYHILTQMATGDAKVTTGKGERHVSAYLHLHVLPQSGTVSTFHK